LQAEARENFNMSWSVLNSQSGWKREKETEEGDLVESKGVAKQRKIFRLKVNWLCRMLANQNESKTYDLHIGASKFELFCAFFQHL
jgi:hypothetical protein